jgi:WD40 repeat protein
MPDKPTHHKLIEDVARFARIFASTIERHPLLVYLGALPFTPVNSILYQRLSDPDLPRIIGGYEQSWSSLSNVFSSDGIISWAVTFSPDGKQIASSCVDKTIHVWDLTSGLDVLPPMHCGADWVHLLMFSPNGRLIVGAAGKNLYAWDVSLRSQVWGPLHGHKDDLTSVVFSANGAKIASGSEDGAIRVWDATFGYEMLRLLPKNKGKIQSVVFTSDGQRVVSGASDGSISIWGVNRAADAISVLRGHEKDVMAIALSPDENWIVSGSLDGTVRLWDAALGVQILSWPVGALTNWDVMTFSSDGCKFICTYSDRMVRVWDVGLWDAASHSGENSVSFKMPMHSYSIAMSPDGRHLAAGTESGVLVYDMTIETQCRSPQQTHRNVSKAVAISPDGSRVICGSQNSIRSWDGASGDEIAPMLVGHQGSIYALAFSPNGRQIVSSSEDRTIRLWDVASCKDILVWSMPGGNEFVFSLAFSCQGEQIVSCSNEIHVWDVSLGSARLIQSFNESASCACFSNDGTAIIYRDRRKGSIHARALDSGAIVSSFDCFLHFDCNINNPIVVDEYGWMAETTIKGIIGKLPDIVLVEGWSACRNIVAFTASSKLYIMHFPPTALISPGT